MISRISRRWAHPTSIRISLAHLSSAAAPATVVAAPRARPARPPPITVVNMGVLNRLIEKQNHCLLRLFLPSTHHPKNKRS